MTNQRVNAIASARVDRWEGCGTATLAGLVASNDLSKIALLSSSIGVSPQRAFGELRISAV